MPDDHSMQAHWKAWCSSKTVEKTSALMNKLSQHANSPFQNLDIQPYHKGGFVVMFSTSHPYSRWADFVFSVISLGQRLGRSWMITGDIEYDPEGMTTETVVSGVSAIYWLCHRDHSAED
ncbi:MAG: hypothetical protein LLG01_15975 [Planctomycetaceae bacterium]|nr:hypothetical protein [Planctomycetaceae bacterium]